MSVLRMSNISLSDINPLKLWQSLFATKYASADEEYFVRIAMERRREASAEVAVRIGVVYDLIMPAVVLSMEAIKTQNLIILFHALHLVLMLPMFINHPTLTPIIKNVGRRFILPISIVAPVAFYAYLLATRSGVDVDKAYFLGVTHIYALCNFIIIIHPGAALARTITMILLSFISYLVFSQQQMTGVLGGTNALSMCVGLFITFSIDRQNRILAQKEFQLMIQAAPAKIVRQSASANDDLGQLFAPSNRHCVCISSDWRGYQALSAKISSDELSKAIGAYYEMTDKLLSHLFPEGNYYTDWIADELFVVIFAKDATEETGLINAGLEFARQLILQKQQFTKDMNLPINIDVGVASGVALIGMMGPTGHRKATALGDVPGQARRYQEIAKQIRKKFGDSDRVLFGYNSLLQITQPFEVKQFDLEAGGKVRDVAEDRVFYMEPTEEPKQDVA